MPSFEFTVPGPPVSGQARNAQRLRNWKVRVRKAAEAAWPTGAEPMGGQLRLVLTYFYDAVLPKLDNDNMCKPIQDALNGLVYVDDNQITATNISRVDLNGEYRVRGISMVLAEAFSREEEFLHIIVAPASRARDLPR
jgi:crossover junction endodeoxyribonuclease RusA